MPRHPYPKIAAAVLAVLTVLAGPASAKPGEAHFAPTQTTYRYDGAHGIFTGDAVYGPENKLFWSLRLSESVRWRESVATGIIIPRSRRTTSGIR